MDDREFFASVFVRSFAAWAIETVLGDQIFAKIVRTARVRPVEGYTSLIAERENFIKTFHRQVQARRVYTVLINTRR